jgi:queuine/archaeosine tRNA-ribosyltransferase
MLGPRLLSFHNVAFYQALMERTREAIREGVDALSALREQAALWTSSLPS